MKRIVYYLDSSHRGITALEQAASFAAQHKVELKAVFIEDQNLMRCAELPFGREISLMTGRSRPLRADSIRRQLRLAHNRFRGCLEEVARHQSLHWSLEVSQTTYDDQSEPDVDENGESVHDVLLLTDLFDESLVAGLPGWIKFPGAVMLLRQGVNPFRQLLLYCDQPDVAPRHIEAALRLADREHLPLQFLLPAQSDSLQLLRTCIENRAPARTIQEVSEWQLRNLLTLTEGQPYLLLLSKDSCLLHEGAVVKSANACLLLP
ncbi:hypothetical protein [Nitrincola sp. MINF-07-Sa-05]|uniref:hypothetical protein n=1 Tax=Nitrincola salilacus TaxID=3400273 RepID=UPI00391842BC